jgi:hypothetical protein
MIKISPNILFLNKIKFGNPVIIILFHSLFVISAYAIANFFFKGFPTPNNSNLMHYDSFYYYTIKRIGYLYLQGKANNLAFFPLFPYVWGLTTLNILFIGVFNYLVFTISFSLLVKTNELPVSIILLIISFPSFIFFVIPYSESLFFLFCTIIINGFKKQSIILVCFGLFGASMVRSVCVIFIPAIVLCDLLIAYTDGFNKKLFIGLFCKLISCLLGFFLACYWMAKDTRKWFYFVDVQKYWHRTWQLPNFPLTTIQANRVLGLDAVAFVFGLVAILICCIVVFNIIYKRFNKSSKSNFRIENYVVFSILYLVGVTVIDTCFTNRIGNSTNIWSLNRHLMCTAFFIVFIGFLYSKCKSSNYKIIGLIITIILGFILSGVFRYLKPALFYLIFFSSFLILTYNQKLKYFFVPIYIVAIIFQISFYSAFLNYLWVG